MRNNPYQPSFRKRYPGQFWTADEVNQIVDALFNQVTGGEGIEVKTFGKQIIISLIKEKTNPIVATRMVITEVKDTYLVCNDLAGNSISVAKPFGLRKGVGWPSDAGQTYVYVDKTHRTASQGIESDEEQYITPPYEIDEEIFAQRIGLAGIDDDSNNPIRWKDKNDGGRCWATETLVEEDYLPLAGGEMAGDIGMDSHSITGAVISGGTA